MLILQALHSSAFLVSLPSQTITKLVIYIYFRVNTQFDPKSDHYFGSF